jgi:hypothetical protein
MSTFSGQAPNAIEADVKDIFLLLMPVGASYCRWGVGVDKLIGNDGE